MATIQVVDVERQRDEEGEITDYVVEYRIPDYPNTYRTEPIPADEFDKEHAKEVVAKEASPLINAPEVEVTFPSEQSDTEPVTDSGRSVSRRSVLLGGAVTGVIGLGGAWMLTQQKADTDSTAAVPETDTPMETATATEPPATDTSTPSAAIENEWPQYKLNVQNTGAAPGRSAPTQGVSSSWVFEAGGRVRGSAVQVGDTVLVGVKDNPSGVYALDAATGDQRWHAPLRMGSTAPAVRDGEVYIGTPSGEVMALALESGEELWTYATDGSIWRSATVTEDLVFVGSGDSRLHAIERSTGERRWAFPTGDKILCEPAVADGRVYCTSRDRNVYGIDIADGQGLWQFETGAKLAQGVAVADGTVFAGSDDGNVYALTAAAGEPEWQFETGAMVRSVPTVSEDTVYFGSRDGYLYAASVETGTEQWALGVGSGVGSPILADRTIYAGAENGRLYAVSDSGEERWRFETDGPILSTPSVQDGRLYVGSDGGRLYALTEG